MVYSQPYVDAEFWKSGRSAHFLFLGALLGSRSTVRQEDRLRQVRSISEGVARDAGLEIFDVQLRREAIGWVLRIVIDRPATGRDADPAAEAVSVADCQRVSRDVSAALDVEFTFEHAYTLEVSSPGLDRPLRGVADCRRFRGRLARFVTSAPVDGQRHLAGRIVEVEDAGAGSGAEDATDTEIVIETGRRVHRIPWSVVSRARLEVEF